MFKSNRERYLIIFTMSFGAVLSDLGMKYLIRYGVVTPEPGAGSWVARMVYHENYGMLGNFPVPQPVILVLTVVALGVLIYAMHETFIKKHDMELLCLSLVLGGALGNFIDRLINGFVFDWLMLFNTSIINIADTFITVGLLGYVFAHWARKKMAQDSMALE